VAADRVIEMTLITGIDPKRVRGRARLWRMAVPKVNQAGALFPG
jgi:hypothetical protein